MSEHRPRFKTVIFDVDSTLAAIEGIDWLAALRGPAIALESEQLTAQAMAGDREHNEAFLRLHGAIVVKPVDSEQGRGIAVNLTSIDEVETAIEHASHFGGGVLLEQFCEGQDLRIVVINHEVVAAAVRQPATVVGDGHATIAELIEKQSRRRAAATGGESRIPVDGETRRCLAAQGYALGDVLPFGTALPVRRTANLHTGGTTHWGHEAQLYPADLAPLASLPTLDPEDIGLMMYTSGTTAHPKACLLSHRALEGAGHALAERWQMTEQDRFWDPLPFFHMSTILPLAACRASGACFIAQEHFDAAASVTSLASMTSMPSATARSVSAKGKR